MEIQLYDGASTGPPTAGETGAIYQVVAPRMRAAKPPGKWNDLYLLCHGDRVRVTVNDLIIKACVDALKAYPKFNAYFDDNGIQANDQINIGIAMAVDEGLLMPAIMDCAAKSLKQIAIASKDLGAKRRPREAARGVAATLRGGC